MLIRRKLLACVAMVAFAAACEPTPQPQQQPAKQLSQTLRQYLRAGRINTYEQYSRCAGLNRLLAGIPSGQTAKLTPEQRKTFQGLALSAVAFQSLAGAELARTNPGTPNIQKVAARQTARNTEAYAASYALVFAAAQVQAKGKKGVLPPLIADDLKLCIDVLRRDIEKARKR